MREPRCIRIFREYEAAEQAKNILAQGGIMSTIKEDKFGRLTLLELGIQPRFRLYIQQEDIRRAASFLAKKLKHG